jgi:hypothetical protein
MFHYLFLFVFMTAIQPPSLKRWLAENQWKHRIILVYAPTDTDPALKQQQAILAADPVGLSERDVLIRELRADQLSEEDRAFLQQSLNITGNSFRLLLIGKDGGVKIRQTRPITLNQLFGTIDGMYMRQQEMKKRGQ